jgi:DNA-binding NarL/FixJ family response regulator
MDLRMPEVDGVTATRLIAGDRRLAGTKVVVLTTFDDKETVFAALRAGASGFLVKDVEPEELLQGIRVVARGDALLSPSVTRAVISAFTADGAGALASSSAAGSAPAASASAPAASASAPAASASASASSSASASRRRAGDPGLAALTDREREVVTLVASGMSNDEIAAKLVMSPFTAKTHVSRAMTKLNARDRAQLVVFAYENGLAGS